MIMEQANVLYALLIVWLANHLTYACLVAHKEYLLILDVSVTIATIWMELYVNLALLNAIIVQIIHIAIAVKSTGWLV